MHRALLVALAALGAAIVLTSIAAAEPAAPRQRVAFELTFYPGQSFRLLPLQTGALKADSGRIREIPEVASRTVMRDGQQIRVYSTPWTLEGRRGTLTIRERNEWVFLGSDANKDGVEDAVAFGTWKLVRGTGQYAGRIGGGRSAHAGLGRAWNARYEGYLPAQ